MFNGMDILVIVILFVIVFQGAILADNHERRMRRLEFRELTWKRVREL